MLSFRTGYLALLILFLTTLVLMAPAKAVTRYVEIWGSNSSANCPRTSPCQTIAFAISQSGPNDRIVVGPGDYTGGLLIPFVKSGMKLESTAGRFGTIIQTRSQCTLQMVNHLIFGQ